MIRYLNSFVITSFIYAFVAVAIFYFYNNSNIIIEKPKAPKTISLNHIELKQETPNALEKPILEEKKELVKEEIKKEIIKPEPVVKKQEPKKEIKKELVKKQEPKSEQIAKQEPTQEVQKTQETVTKNEVVAQKEEVKSIEKVVDEEKVYLDKYLVEIRNLINQNVKYPIRARKLSIEGVVVAKFKLEKDGTVHNITILKGHDFLQNSTIEAIEQASKSFPKTPKSIEIQIPIEYKLI
jgi:protein TonB